MGTAALWPVWLGGGFVVAGAVSWTQAERRRRSVADERWGHSRLAMYQPLGDWLAAQSRDCVTLTFAAVEQILGRRLPPSAWSSSSWWWQMERRSVSAARVWRAAGWRLGAVDRRRSIVTFVRAGPASAPAP